MEWQLSLPPASSPPATARTWAGHCGRRRPSRTRWVSGPHPLSPTARPTQRFDLPEFSDPSWEPSLAGVRVGFSTDLGGRLNVRPEVRAVVDATAPVFTDLRATVDDGCIDLSDAAEVFFTQRAYDFAAWYGPLLRARPEKFRDFVAWNIELGLSLTVADLLSKDAARVRLASAVNDFFADHDVLVTTTSQVLPFDASLDYPRVINGVLQENYLDWMAAATLISPTGCPSVSVSAGFSRPSVDPAAPELPVGIQIIGAPGRDVEVLQVAHAFEAATGYGRRHPEL
ncbi:MAG: amidase family protein [Corynebacterium variabile]|uniref:amidase family protein n=1 Tax=Corynebacterium variabile TaxID=1727 RepID=UPI003F968DB9